jgi:predicted transcriptional regulator
MRQAEIARLLGVTPQKVYYWSHTDFNIEQKRRKKFSEFYANKIAKIARNKTTSVMSYRKISRMTNTSLLKRNIKYKGKQMKISFKTVSNYLREIYGKPKKIGKDFYLSEAQKIKRVDFCKKNIRKRNKF